MVQDHARAVDILLMQGKIVAAVQHAIKHRCLTDQIVAISASGEYIGAT
jgi:hypothetical protein